MHLSRRRSITYRLTTGIAGAAAIILLLLGFLIGQAIERHFRVQDMALLSGKLTLVEHLLREGSDAHLNRNLAGLLNDALIGHHGLGVQVTTDHGVAYRSEGTFFFPASMPSPTAPGDLKPFTFKAGQKAFLAISANVAVDTVRSPYTVTIATDISEQDAFMKAFAATLWGSVGLAVLLNSLLVWYIAHREMAPLKAIRAEAERITAQRLNQRLSTDLVPQELVGLVEALNTMLARLEDAFRRLSDFSSDLAHELRTPVTALLTQTQVGLSKARTPEQYQEILFSNAEELERLARMVGDMLFLAKADNALVVPHREPVDLAAEVDGLFDFYEALAAEKCVRLVRQGEAHLDGDRLMLRRAFGNLMSNAVRHTPAGEAIHVLIEETPAVISVTVSNPGPVIPEKALPRLFDRFYRADDARQRGSDGTGLGLAITHSIVAAHGGRISVRSGAEETRFCVELPKAVPGPASSSPRPLDSASAAF